MRRVDQARCRSSLLMSPWLVPVNVQSLPTVACNRRDLKEHSHDSSNNHATAFPFCWRQRPNDSRGDDGGRGKETPRIASPHGQLATLGTVPFGTAMGHGARGLLDGRFILGLPPARPCTQPCLSVGRGRNAWYHGPRVPPVLRAHALEWSRRNS